MKSTRVAAHAHYTRPASYPPGVTRDLRKALALIALLLCVLLPARLAAQNVQHSKASQDLGMRHNFKVDPVSLSMNIDITFGSYKGRGGTVMPVGLMYSSKVWRLDYFGHIVGGTVEYPDDTVYTMLTPVYGDPNHDRMPPGWSSTLFPPEVVGDVGGEWYDALGNPCSLFDSCTPPGSSSVVAFYIRRLRLRMPDGSIHEMRAVNDDQIRSYQSGVPQITYPITYVAADGSHIRYTETGNPDQGGQAITYLPDGSRYEQGPAGIKFIDRHGNTLTFNSNETWSDALGRNVGLASMPGMADTTINYTFTYRSLKVENHPELSALTDFNQPLHHDGNGTWHNTLPTYPALFDSGTSSDRIGPGAIFNPSVLYQIESPDGSKYTFTYNVYGEIDKIV